MKTESGKLKEAIQAGAEAPLKRNEERYLNVD